jgi:hypothetical protein
MTDLLPQRQSKTFVGISWRPEQILPEVFATRMMGKKRASCRFHAVGRTGGARLPGENAIGVRLGPAPQRVARVEASASPLRIDFRMLSGRHADVPRRDGCLPSESSTNKDSPVVGG